MIDSTNCCQHQTDCTPHGGVRSVTYFLNDNNQLVPASHALFQEVHEFDEQNRVLQVTVTRIKQSD